MKILFYTAFLSGCFLSGCVKENRLEKEIAAIPVEMEVIRYEEAFYKASPAELPSLKAQFPYLFPQQYPDSLWINKLNDTLEKGLAREVIKTFGSFEPQKQALKSLFQHIKYYVPNQTLPAKVITLISDVDYANRVIYTDSLLLLSLDNFLGSKHFYYEGIYDYIKQNMTPERLPVDVAEAFANRLISPPSSGVFLDQMVYEGKKLYLKTLLMPSVAPQRQIGYTDAQWQWMQANEAMAWQYFLDKELLYSTETDLPARFIYPAPYSKFYLSIDNESPPRIGQYMGWQIVNFFMQNNDQFTLEDLLHTAAKDIFSKSRYKPPRP